MLAVRSFFEKLNHVPKTHSTSFEPTISTSSTSESMATSQIRRDQPFTVVELFQSQGCNSCPPANANLIELASRDSEPSNILLLTYHVTYWDYLGWQDTFGERIFDQRQRDYVQRLGLRSAFTPQVIVNGRASGVGSSKSDLNRILREGRAAQPMSVEVKVVEGDQENKVVSVSSPASSAPFRGSLEVSIATYDPAEVNVPIKKGENSGRTLPHLNVVKSIQRIGTVKAGEETLLPLPSIAQGVVATVLVQDGRGGPIVGAAVV